MLSMVPSRTLLLMNWMDNIQWSRRNGQVEGDVPVELLSAHSLGPLVGDSLLTEDIFRVY